ncbi:MAG TPA: DUF1983 domain-containing protein [Acidovorax sp.]
MSDDRKDLPSVNSDNFLQRVREAVQTYLGSQGDLLDRGVTLRDLSDAGLIDISKTYRVTRRGAPVAGPGPAVGAGGDTGTPGEAYTPDLTPPPTPEGFTVGAGISYLFIGCSPALYSQGHGHMATRVYGATRASGAPAPVFADAVVLTEFQGTVFAHATNPATTWHLWIKWVTRDGVESALPAGGTNGLVATTGQDVERLLAALSGKISESQLYSSLGSRINLIDAPSTTPGSVNNRLSAEALARTNALAQEGTTRAQALLIEAAARESAVSDLQTQIDTVVAVAGGDLSSVISAVQTEQTALAAADAAEAASRETLAVQMRGNYTGTDAAAVTTGLLYSERQARIADQEAEVSSRNAAIVSNSASAEATQKAINDALIAGMGVVGAASATRTQAEQDARIASVTQETNARISAIAAEASARLQLVAIVNSNAAVVAQEQLTRATADSALASDINALQSTVNGNTAAIQTEATTRASQTGELYAQYTVKVDTNGYVTGFGLANTVRNGVPTSEFIIRADNFAIAPVSTDNAAADGSPFFYRTTTTTINGASVPPGAYLKSAFIHDATITTAKIANLAVDDAKIANLSVSKLDAGSLKVGSYISSSNYAAGSQGFAIWANGNAEFNNATVRGTVYASSGSFTGAVYASSGSFSGSLYSNDGTIGGVRINGNGLNAGSYYGYAWPTDGGGGFHIGPNGLLFGNANLGRYFQIEANGDIHTPGFNVINGTMTVNQANVINTLNVAGNAVTSSVASFGGTVSFNGLGAYTPIDLCTLGFSSTGAPALLFAGVHSLMGLADVTSMSVIVRTLVDGWDVRSTTQVLVNSQNFGDGGGLSTFGGSLAIPPILITGLSPGWHTVSLQIYATSALGYYNNTASGGALVILETKR